MARYSVGCSVSGTTNGNPRVSSAGSVADVLNATTTSTDSGTVTTDKTTVAANVATLVADGASPTQAHVTTLNTNWAALKTAVEALQADLGGDGPSNGDVVLSFNASNVTTKNQLRAAVAALLAILDGSSVLS